MKIELESDHIGEHNLRLLRSWAIQQLSMAYDKLENTAECFQLNDIQDAITDLETMKQPLDALHHVLREQLVHTHQLKPSGIRTRVDTKKKEPRCHFTVYVIRLRYIRE